jgi:hypothetical protein
VCDQYNANQTPRPHRFLYGFCCLLSCLEIFAQLSFLTTRTDRFSFGRLSSADRSTNVIRFWFPLAPILKRGTPHIYTCTVPRARPVCSSLGVGLGVLVFLLLWNLVQTSGCLPACRSRVLISEPPHLPRRLHSTGYIIVVVVSSSLSSVAANLCLI